MATKLAGLTVQQKELVEKYEREVKEVRAFTALISEQQDRYAVLSGQLKENELVQEELEVLEKDPTQKANVIYKLIGPVLIKQDYNEAKGNVNKRMEFIQNEMDITNKNMENLKKKTNGKEKCCYGFTTKNTTTSILK